MTDDRQSLPVAELAEPPAPEAPTPVPDVARRLEAILLILDEPQSLVSLAAAVAAGPIAKLRAVVTGEAIAVAASGAEVETAGSQIAALATARSSPGAAMPLLTSLDHLAPLAQPGRGQPWQLSVPQTLRSERRDAHRRTRRARPRRSSVMLAQSQLFANLDG